MDSDRRLRRRRDSTCIPDYCKSLRLLPLHGTSIWLFVRTRLWNPRLGLLNHDDSQSVPSAWYGGLGPGPARAWPGRPRPAGVWPTGLISFKFTVMVAIIRTNVTTVVNSATYFKQNLSLRLELRLELQGILETFEVIQENNHSIRLWNNWNPFKQKNLLKSYKKDKMIVLCNKKMV